MPPCLGHVMVAARPLSSKFAMTRPLPSAVRACLWSVLPLLFPAVPAAAQIVNASWTGGAGAGLLSWIAPSNWLSGIAPVCSGTFTCNLTFNSTPSGSATQGAAATRIGPG